MALFLRLPRVWEVACIFSQKRQKARGRHTALQLILSAKASQHRRLGRTGN